MSLTDAWVNYFRNQYYKIDEADILIWQADLNTEFKHLSDAEVIDAIRAMIDDPKCPDKFPKIKHLAFQIRQARENNTAQMVNQELIDRCVYHIGRFKQNYDSVTEDEKKYWVECTKHLIDGNVIMSSSDTFTDLIDRRLPTKGFTDAEKDILRNKAKEIWKGGE